MNLKQNVYGLTKKIVDYGSDYALKMMPSHDLDVMRGEQADAKRQHIIANREARMRENPKGY